LVVVGMVYEIWHNKMSLATGVWSGRTWVGGGTTLSPPALVASSPTRLDMVVQGVDYRIWHDSYEGGSWSGWSPIGDGTTLETPALACISNYLQVVVRGVDHRVYWSQRYLGSASWSGWQCVLGGSTIAAPAMTVSTYNGLPSVEVFVKGGTRYVYHATYGFSGGAYQWVGWDRATAQVDSRPVAISPDGNSHVVAIIGNSIVYKTYNQGGGWGPVYWYTFPGSSSEAPGLAGYANGMMIAVRGMDNRVWVNDRN